MSGLAEPGCVEAVTDRTYVLAKGKLLFVPLRKGTLGQPASQLLGALFVSRLWQAAQPASPKPNLGHFTSTSTRSRTTSGSRQAWATCWPKPAGSNLGIAAVESLIVVTVWALIF